MQQTIEREVRPPPVVYSFLLGLTYAFFLWGLLTLFVDPTEVVGAYLDTLSGWTWFLAAFGFGIGFYVVARQVVRILTVPFVIPVLLYSDRSDRRCYAQVLDKTALGALVGFMINFFGFVVFLFVAFLVIASRLVWFLSSGVHQSRR